MKGMELLGLKAQDKVSGIKGIITSISYDLYGCIQGVITPEVTKENTKLDGYWYDIKRFKILSKKPVIELPDFEGIENGNKGEMGSAEKPLKT